MVRCAASLALAVLAMTISVTAPAATSADMKVLVPTGTSDAAKEAANRKLVMDFLWEFFDQKKHDTCSRFVADDFINHDANEPSGAKAFCAFIDKNDARQQVYTQPRSQTFIIAQGDLVMVAHPGGGPGAGGPGGDGQQSFVVNVFRVANGKIAEWWFDQGAPRQAAAAPRAQ
ncbi:MAG: nuclear transport factor 2 family protein [Steroidobacteraceae bacterium]